MSQLARIRQRQQSWGRRALGMFVAVWLNLALQPCAMAFESGEDHDCPHCPPAEIHEHGHKHGSGNSGDNKVPCVDATSDCLVAEDMVLDGRTGKLELKDAPADNLVAITVTELSIWPAKPADTTSMPRYATVHTGAPPPLHVLYCVYLD